jgi:WD40 repeat protein
MSGGLTLWDVESGRSRSISGAQTGSMTSVAFSPDGGLLAAAGPADRNVRLWDPSSGRLHLQLADHVGGTTSVSLSPAGRRLASAGNDGMVRSWKATTGEPLTRLDGRSSWLSQVAFSADGRTLAAAGGDSHIRVWDLDDIEETGADRAPAECPQKIREAHPASGHYNGRGRVSRGRDRTWRAEGPGCSGTFDGCGTWALSRG